MLYEPGKTISKIVPVTETHFVVPQFAVQTYLNPTMLLHFDGAQDSTVFLDATGRHSLTAFGNAKVDTSQSKFGGGSLFVDDGFFGTGSYLQVNGTNTDLVFGTNDFTIDFWGMVRDITTPALGAAYDARVNTADNDPWITCQGGHINYNINASGELISGDAIALVIMTWFHFALTRKDGVSRLFTNGTQVGVNYIAADNLGNGTDRPIIGSRGNPPGASFSWDGWIDEMRVINGAAAWINDFTPPTAPYRVS